MPWSEAVFQYLPEGTEETKVLRQKSHPYLPRIEPGTSRVRNASANHCTTTLGEIKLIIEITDFECVHGLFNGIGQAAKVNVQRNEWIAQ